jgi:hypothetical protein
MLSSELFKCPLSLWILVMFLPVSKDQPRWNSHLPSAMKLPGKGRLNQHRIGANQSRFLCPKCGDLGMESAKPPCFITNDLLHRPFSIAVAMLPVPEGRPSNEKTWGQWSAMATLLGSMSKRLPLWYGTSSSNGRTTSVGKEPATVAFAIHWQLSW